jgi:hypothetical protein
MSHSNHTNSYWLVTLLEWLLALTTVMCLLSVSIPDLPLTFLHPFLNIIPSHFYFIVVSIFFIGDFSCKSFRLILLNCVSQPLTSNCKGGIIFLFVRFTECLMMDLFTIFLSYSVQSAKNFNVSPSFISNWEGSWYGQMTVVYCVAGGMKIHELSLCSVQNVSLNSKIICGNSLASSDWF